MKLAFSRPTANEADQRTLFSNFRAIGYDGLQLKQGQYNEYRDDPERFLAEWGDYPGAASAVITGGKLDDDGLALLRKVVGFASAVGSALVVFCHAEPREGLSKNDIRAFARTLSEVGKEALEAGTKLSMHHHYGTSVMHREDFDVFFDTAMGQSVGLTVDTAHLVASGIEDVAGTIRDFSHVIDNFHLKDLADRKFELLGRGRIDFAPIFAAIKAVGYDGWVSADEESGADIVEGMKECYEFIRKGLS